MKRPRDLALKVLNRLSNKSGFSKNILDSHFKRNPHFDARDRAFISHLVQGVLRWRNRLDWTIEQASDFPLKKITISNLNILRLALYQILFMDRVPDSAAVNEAVNQAKINNPRRAVSFVNGILRNICRQKKALPLPDRGKNLPHYLSVLHSYPLWLVKKWIGVWGVPFTEGLLAAGNRISPLVIRTNTLKLSRSQLIHQLAEEGIHGVPTPYVPEGIIIEDFRGRVDSLASFKSGLFQVQDEAAQITSHFLAPPPEETILDICAGHGGKSSHLAELIGDRGPILALDSSMRRLVSLSQNARRLGIKSIVPLVADASTSLSSLLCRKFDRILIDAPCSGLGVISRHPDIKWNREEKDIRQLALLQKSILNQAAPLLDIGGRMLYVTCTISRQENEEIVEDFLRKQPAFSLQNMKDHGPSWGRELVDDQGFLRTIPHVHHMDGFFAALFTKKSD
ncbi:MAG: 16S rRNA (cytosine(967)-C(5))-methyltransferase RsmB [Deltaproteobacteria bacterium]|nr:16S rRNA (cytosine(967)-C(5))-methyltransferase RsmB [Deltaproteobacteria bacterium]